MVRGCVYMAKTAATDLIDITQFVQELPLLQTHLNVYLLTLEGTGNLGNADIALVADCDAIRRMSFPSACDRNVVQRI